MQIINTPISHRQERPKVGDVAIAREMHTQDELSFLSSSLWIHACEGVRAASAERRCFPSRINDLEMRSAEFHRREHKRRRAIGIGHWLIDLFCRSKMLFTHFHVSTWVVRRWIQHIRPRENSLFISLILNFIIYLNYIFNYIFK